MEDETECIWGMSAKEYFRFKFNSEASFQFVVLFNFSSSSALLNLKPRHTMRLFDVAALNL